MSTARKASLRVLVIAGLIALQFTACRPPASELWTEHCARCHGEDGRGVESQRTFYPGADLTRSELIADQARGSIYQRIAFGWGTMPGFKHQLRQSELEKLVTFSIELASIEVTDGQSHADPERR